MEEVQYVTPTLESWNNPVDSSMASRGVGGGGAVPVTDVGWGTIVARKRGLHEEIALITYCTHREHYD